MAVPLPPLPPAEAPWMASETYRLGLDLYNHGYWWEAHEAWEDLWRHAPRGHPYALLLRGLIQAAACHLKVLEGRREGGLRLADRAAGLLRRAGQEAGLPRVLGLAVEATALELEAYVPGAAPIRGRGSRGHHAAGFPVLEPKLSGTAGPEG